MIQQNSRRADHRLTQNPRSTICLNLSTKAAICRTVQVCRHRDEMNNRENVSKNVRRKISWRECASFKIRYCLWLIERKFQKKKTARLAGSLGSRWRWWDSRPVSTALEKNGRSKWSVNWWKWKLWSKAAMSNSSQETQAESNSLTDCIHSTIESLKPFYFLIYHAPKANNRLAQIQTHPR